MIDLAADGSSCRRSAAGLNRPYLGHEGCSQLCEVLAMCQNLEGCPELAEGTSPQGIREGWLGLISRYV